MLRWWNARATLGLMMPWIHCTHCDPGTTRRSMKLRGFDAHSDQSFPNSGNWSHSTRYAMAELVNARLHGPYIEQCSHCVPRAMEPITGLGKRLVQSRERGGGPRTRLSTLDMALLGTPRMAQGMATEMRTCAATDRRSPSRQPPGCCRSACRTHGHIQY